MAGLTRTQRLHCVGPAIPVPQNDWEQPLHSLAIDQEADKQEEFSKTGAINSLLDCIRALVSRSLAHSPSHDPHTDSVRRITVYDRGRFVL